MQNQMYSLYIVYELPRRPRNKTVINFYLAISNITLNVEK